VLGIRHGVSRHRRRALRLGLVELGANGGERDPEPIASRLDLELRAAMRRDRARLGLAAPPDWRGTQGR
jgi:hypothetical protein